MQGQTTFLLLFVMEEKGTTRSGHVRLCARVAMEEGLLSVCELARALVNDSWSMNIAIFSTQDLQEQGGKSYVASYQANKELAIFPRELCQ